jgi:hypothetical protein
MSTLTQTTLQPRTRTAPDEQAARRTLRAQIARQEEELAGLLCSAWPRVDPLRRTAPDAAAGARALPLGELESMRDGLAEELRQAKRELALRTAAEEDARRLREEMLLAPEQHRGVVVSNAEMGEPGCTRFEARPRLGLLGMLMRWWRVIVSSGCP